MVDEEKKEDGEEGSEESQADPPKRSKKKLLLIVGIVLGLLLLIGTPVVIFTMQGDDASGHDDLQAAVDAGDDFVPEGFDDVDEYDEDEEALGAIFPMETFVVNLSGGQGYLRCQVQIEFEGRDVPARFYAKLVPIRDAMIRILTSRSADEVAGVQGKDELKHDLQEVVNEMLRKQVARNIYFTQFVVQ